MVWMSLKASNGSLVSARNDPAHSLVADRTGVGPWEMFHLHNMDPSGGPLAHGHHIRLQTRWARHVVADSTRGDQILADRVVPSTWETFLIHARGGAGPISHGDQISLKAHTGRWVTAEDGGGGPLVANRSHVEPGTWERFEVGLWDITLVHLRTADGEHFVTAERDGRVVATRAHARAWETLALVHPHREGGLRSGDQVFLRAWDGQFLSARNGGGGELNSKANRASSWETFRILAQDGSETITHRSSVALQTWNGEHYVVAVGAGGEAVLANRPSAGPWEKFTVEFAEGEPMSLSVAPSAPPAPDHPLPTEPPVVSGVQPIFTVIVTYSDMEEEPDPTLTPEVVEQGLFSGSTCPRAWFEMATLRNHAISNAGVLGPIQLPLPFELYAENSPSVPLNATREFPGDWAKFSIEPVRGTVIEHRTEVRIHSKSKDNYVRVRDQGEFLLTGGNREDDTTAFVVERVDGRDVRIEHGTHIYLVAYDGRYVAAESGGGDHLRADRDSADIWEQFIVEREAGSGPLNADDTIHLKSERTGLYVCADRQARWPDLFNVARKMGISMEALTRTDSGRAAPLMLDFSGAGGASKRDIDFTAVGDVSYKSPVASVSLRMRDGFVQGAAQIEYIRAILIHEICHQLYDLPDRYRHRIPVHGDVTVNQLSPGAEERFFIKRQDGTSNPIDNGDPVHLVAYNGEFVTAPERGANLVNLRAGDPRLSETFKIQREDGDGAVEDGDTVSLKTGLGHFVVAERGGGEWLAADRVGPPGAWEKFTIELVTGTGGISDGSQITLAHHGTWGQFYVSASENGRTSNTTALESGYEIGISSGGGPGGDFDIMDNHTKMISMAAYDKIKKGWIRPRVFTPEDRICVRLRPVNDHPEAVILWDPELPGEWYVVENRRPRAGLDDVPSAGLIVSWVDEREETWRRLIPEDSSRWHQHYPAVIAAGGRSFPSNPMIAPASMRPGDQFGRQSADAAFTSGSVVLLRGDGTPSRFHCSFGSSGAEASILSLLGP